MTLGLQLTIRLTDAGTHEVFEPCTGRVFLTGTRRACERWIEING